MQIENRRWRVATVRNGCVAKERKHEKSKKIKFIKKSIVGIVTLLIVPHVLAEETIIQQEKNIL